MDILADAAVRALRFLVKIYRSELGGLLSSIVISLWSSFLFWHLTFRYTDTKILFSDCIERSKNVLSDQEDSFRYRLRLCNTGRRRLIEVSITARLSIASKRGSRNTTYFTVGEEGTIPQLQPRSPRRRCGAQQKYNRQAKRWFGYTTYIYGIYANDMVYQEFSKRFYTPALVEKAKKRELVIDDIFAAYPHAVLTVFVFGNDSITGARKMYESKEYRKEHIINGEFHGFRGIPETGIWARCSRRKRLQLLKDELSAIDQPEAVLKMFLELPISSSQEVLRLFAAEQRADMRRAGGDTQKAFVYIPGKRRDRVLLIAHADTVWDARYTGRRPYCQTIRQEDGCYWGADADGRIGASARAGCAIAYLLLKSGHSVLILDGGERGQIGANYLRSAYPALLKELNHHQYAIELHLDGDAAYTCRQLPVSREFTEFIQRRTGFQPVSDHTHTDMAVLCESICGVRFNTGCHDPHTSIERLSVSEWLHTFHKIADLLKKAQRQYPLDSGEAPPS